MARRSARAAPLAAKWRMLAEGRCAEKGEQLTPARLAVYAELLGPQPAAFRLRTHRAAGATAGTQDRAPDRLPTPGLPHANRPRPPAAIRADVLAVRPSRSCSRELVPALFLVWPRGRGGVERTRDVAVPDRRRARVPTGQRGCRGQGVVRHLCRRRARLSALLTGADRRGTEHTLVEPRARVRTYQAHRASRDGSS